MFKAPFFAPLLYPSCTWKVDTDEKNIYLTFDDGPIPGVTEFVLKTLHEFDAMATFFCIGENVVKHPEILKKIRDGGHGIGNHTFNHLNGWSTSVQEYVDNTEKCRVELVKNGVETSLFRPPYGKIKSGQISKLKSDYQIIMWSVLTKDYQPSVQPEIALQKSFQYTSGGSIVVMHDSLRAEPTMQYILPRILKKFSGEGYLFKKL